MVRTRHVVVPIRPHVFNRWLFRKRTEAIIAVSQQAADSFGRLRPSLAPKLRVIYSAVDLETFDPGKRSAGFRARCGAGESQPLIGLVARIQRIKGQRQFIEAAAAVSREFPSARFLISGTGCDGKFSLLRAHAAAVGSPDNITFMGWLDDVSSAIASLDIGVVASLGSEGSSRITYEYMASGVPVVATRVGGIPEIISDGETGLLVDPGDVGQLADALARLLRESGLARNMREAALERARTFHNYDRWIGETVEVYEDAIRKAHDA